MSRRTLRWIIGIGAAVTATALCGCAGGQSKSSSGVTQQIAHVSGLPTAILESADHDHLLVALQQGLVVRIGRTARQGDRPTTALDLSSRVASEGEQGLLNLISLGKGKIAAYWSNQDGAVTVSTWSISPDGVIDPISEHPVFSLPHALPYHKGGGMAFAPPSTLYVGVGDIGLDFGERPAAQDPSLMVGSILAVDLAKKGEGAIKVMARGLRNPWRITLENHRRVLWIGDVGDRSVEEIDRLDLDNGSRQPANFGWPRSEGNTLRRPDLPDNPDALSPVWTAVHRSSVCGVVVGPVVENANRQPSLLVGDLCSRAARGLATPSLSPTLFRLPLKQTPISFSVTHDNRVLVAGSEGGIFELPPPGTAQAPPPIESSAASGNRPPTAPVDAAAPKPAICSVFDQLAGLAQAIAESPSAFRAAVESVQASLATPNDLPPEVRKAVTEVATVVDTIHERGAAAGWEANDPSVAALTADVASGKPPFDSFPSAIQVLSTWGESACR